MIRAGGPYPRRLPLVGAPPRPATATGSVPRAARVVSSPVVPFRGVAIPSRLPRPLSPAARPSLVVRGATALRSGLALLSRAARYPSIAARHVVSFLPPRPTNAGTVLLGRSRRPLSPAARPSLVLSMTRPSSRGLTVFCRPAFATLLPAVVAARPATVFAPSWKAPAKSVVVWTRPSRLQPPAPATKAVRATTVFLPLRPVIAGTVFLGRSRPPSYFNQRLRHWMLAAGLWRARY